jgi:hypothetical protein
MNMKRVLFFSMVAFLMAPLVSCTAKPGAQVSKTPMEFTREVSLSSPTLTRTPSQTPQPTGTSVPTPSPSPTVTTEVLEQCSRYDQSPSGIWLLFDCGFDPDGKGYVAVLHNMLTYKSWVYTYCTFTDDCRDGAFPSEGSIRAKAWSPDSHYLYAELDSGVDGGSWFGYATKLLRINLHNGFASILVNSTGVYEFSPKVDKLAYIPYVWEEAHEVYVRDLESSNQFNFLLESEYDDAGDIVWSSDGTQFIFLAVRYGGSSGLGSSSLMLVDIASRSRAVLIKDHPGYLMFQEWLSDGILKYQAYPDDESIILYSIPHRQMVTTPAP